MKISLNCNSFSYIYHSQNSMNGVQLKSEVYKARIACAYRFAVFSPMNVVHCEVVSSANCIWLSYRDITFKNYYKFDMTLEWKWKL